MTWKSDFKQRREEEDEIDDNSIRTLTKEVWKRETVVVDKRDRFFSTNKAKTLQKCVKCRAPKLLLSSLSSAKHGSKGLLSIYRRVGTNEEFLIVQNII